MKPLFIFGTAGQARDVADIAAAVGYRPVFVTHDRNEIAAWSQDDELVLEEVAVRRTSEAFVIGIGDNDLRARIAKRYAATLRFASLLHPDASFGRGQRARIEERVGTVVFAGVRFTNNISVGDFCNFNLNASVSHDCEIGDFVNVSPGANITGNVRIGAGAWIGAGAVINQGSNARKLEIGCGTTIGSGAVVVRDCEPNSVYAGVPARKVP